MKSRSYLLLVSVMLCASLFHELRAQLKAPPRRATDAYAASNRTELTAQVFRPKIGHHLENQEKYED